jgi:hypothetical protein
VVIPVLTISAGPGPGMATVAWQPDQPGWKLQQAATPNPVVWHDAPTGSANPVVVPMGSQPGFFRVFKR